MVDTLGTGLGCQKTATRIMSLAFVVFELIYNLLYLFTRIYACFAASTYGFPPEGACRPTGMVGHPGARRPMGLRMGPNMTKSYENCVLPE